MGFLILTLVCILAVNCNIIKEAKQNVRQFPDGFIFGAATASYQIEGGWDADGKTENIWDHMTHKDPCLIVDCSNGDVADDSYNLYKRDVEMMRELGLQFYRFSLSWNRILPTSFPDKPNAAGIQYYNNLINEMLKYNIEPMITLYHWDLPQRLQELGGWTNPHIVDWFADFARVAFENFGDRVKYWITINEPREVCFQGYGDVTKAPRLNMKGIAEYMCAKNLLVAHAKAYHIYDKEFRGKWGGTIGITLSMNWYEPETEEDNVSAEEMRQFEVDVPFLKDFKRGGSAQFDCKFIDFFDNCVAISIKLTDTPRLRHLNYSWGQYAHPIFTESGDFPPIMKEKIAAKSEAQGFYRSRLPEFTSEELELVRGSSDFLGLNHYTTNMIKVDDSVTYDVPSYWDDIGATRYQPEEWDGAASTWLKVVPWGFHKLLNRLRELYGNPPIMVTENGFSSFGGLEDDDRVSYYRLYLDAMLDAMDDGCNVVGYAAWSLMDNFEWMRGYTERFGLYEVDYTSPNRTRTPRKSAFVYKEIVRTRTLDTSYEPDTNLMTIDEGH
ncbi:unnamed protein product [Diatraea saccharalis]|uniref:Beta-glucosidase n=1 Tax=Diatraea saccharalis TaxID=40085 RepID=A0A9N9QVK2_9NEOP|nr:unnamed protein product [Diatraea saccharalis]